MLAPIPAGKRLVERKSRSRWPPKSAARIVKLVVAKRNLVVAPSPGRAMRALERCRSRRQTPAPPPFLSMNSTPALGRERDARTSLSKAAERSETVYCESPPIAQRSPGETSTRRLAAARPTGTARRCLLTSCSPSSRADGLNAEAMDCGRRAAAHARSLQGPRRPSRDAPFFHRKRAAADR